MTGPASELATDTIDEAAKLPLQPLSVFSLAWHLAWFDTQARYSRSRLGPFWLTLQAAIFVAIVGTTMASMLQQNFAVYFSSFSISYILWVFFSGVILGSTAAFASGASFLKDRGINPVVLLAQPFLQQVIYLAHTLILAVGIFLFMRIGSFIGFVMALPGFALFFLTAFLFVLPVALLAVRYHDSKPLLESGMLLLFLTSPILWPMELVIGRAPLVALVNPIAHLIAIWREPLLNETFPLTSFALVVLLDLVLVVLCGILWKHVKRAALWL